MKELIRKIRHSALLSQQDFGERLGVSFATVNRWENGKVVPNRLAQLKLYDFCKLNNIPVYDMLLQRIQDEVDSLKIDEGRTVLFHGSKSGIKGKIAPISRAACDFGAGFYMGTVPGQALTLICDYEESRFYIVSVSTADLNIMEIPICLDWAMTVAYNRGKMEKLNGTAMYERYTQRQDNLDLFIGSIADDRMFYVLDNFFLGNITDQALINSLSALRLGRQYVAVTQRGCDNVRIEKEISISYLERLVMRDVSEENRAEGIRLANEICRNYRREGFFFDEIIDRFKEL